MSMKNCVTLRLAVHQEGEEWIDWFLDVDDPDVIMPYDEKECIPVLEKYDVIFVGEKWFAGSDAKKAIDEAFRIARNDSIKIVDVERDRLIAEIYDCVPLYCEGTDGKFRCMSGICGDITTNIQEYLKDPVPGDTVKFSYKGW